MLSRNLCDESRPLAVFSFDTDAIKRYVLGSTRLAQIRGASRIIELASSPHDALREIGLPASTCIYSGGGGGLLLLPANRAEDVQNTLETQYAARSNGAATVTCAWIPVAPSELLTGLHAPVIGAAGDSAAQHALGFRSEELSRGHGFGDIVAHLGAALRTKKAHRLVEPAPLAPEADRCPTCGVRQAGKVESEVTKTLACEVCVSKERGCPDGEREVFEKLGDYIGVLALDGNSMGALLEKVRTITGFAAVSASVARAFDALRTRLDELVADERSVLLQGGDDLLAVVPGRRALDLALQLGRHIERELSAVELPSEAGDALQADVRNLGIGIGCVVAHSHFPIHFLTDYAEELQRSAKRHVYRNRGTSQATRSAVDFAILSSSSPITSTIARWRRTHVVLCHEPLQLTQRPYSLDEFQTFLSSARQLYDDVPRSQVHQLATVVRHGRLRSENYFRYQVARSSENGWGTWLRSTHGDVPLPNAASWLWRHDGGVSYSTPLVDYLEVARFLEKANA